MKYLYSLLLVLVLFSCQKEKEENTAASAETENNRAFFHLEGNVKTFSERSYAASGTAKGASAHEILTEYDTDYTFNEAGGLVSEKKWKADGKPLEETTYEGMSKKLQTTHYSNGMPGTHTKYVWEKGNNTAIIETNPDNSVVEEMLQVYKNNKLTEKRKRNAKGSILSRVTYEYDTRGNLRAENNFPDYTATKYTTVYKYDSGSRKIAEESYDNNSKVLYKTAITYKDTLPVKKVTTNEKGITDHTESFSYDTKGNLLDHVLSSSVENTIIRNAYTYDDRGNRTGWENFMNGALFSKGTYAYDGKNNLTGSKTTDGSGKILENKAYTYVYDKNGNWVKKTIFINGTPNFIVERRITYFK